MKKLPIGLQGFKNIIENDYLYVDKTRQIFELINQGSLYFLSRPRRFGKSLLISTLTEIFKGNKELFKGLYIAEQTDYDWKPYPVLQFNFAKIETKPSDLEDSLKRQIRLLGEEFNIKITAKNLMDQVEDLVKEIAEQHGPVVFLVDEYDKPIIDFLTEKKKANANRKMLRKFFSPLKDLEAKGHLRFLFVTGVSKFSKVSIFSDLNNLTDLTIDPLSIDVVGITQQELLHNFKDYIHHSAKELAMPEADLLVGIKLWYDGYSYDGKTFLYNPFSLLNFFRKSHFGNFWFATGTPTFLVNIIRDNQVGLKELESKEVPETFFDKFTVKHLDIHGLLFQTGYLTIKSTYREQYQHFYQLGYPNEEVRRSFIHNLLEAFTYQSSTIVGNSLVKMQMALGKGQVEEFVNQLEVLLSDISYHLLPKSKKQPTSQDEDQNFAAWEGYFQTIVYLICAFLNLSVQTEITKHKGRLDLLASTEDFLYLMEFKLDETAENAIAQIKSRQYADAYKNSPKKIILVGISFSKAARNVESWVAEEWVER